MCLCCTDHRSHALVWAGGRAELGQVWVSVILIQVPWLGGRGAGGLTCWHEAEEQEMLSISWAEDMRIFGVGAFLASIQK